MKSLLLTFGFVSSILTSIVIADTSQPNVLLILTDDQGYGDTSLHGSPHLNTPNMDSIGEEGVRLDRFYVSPVCAPTRASLMTGRYHLRTGAFGVTRREEVVNPNETTIAELMREGGYATGCFGKWHNGTVYPETPNGQGFDEFLGFLGGVTQRYFDPELNHNGVESDYEGYITEILAESAMNWMDKQISDDKPFFCYVPFNAPHTPGLVDEKYWNPFYNRQVGRWESVIFGMIQSIDEQMGRMLQFLEDKNQAENTIVVFMTDNGPNTWRYNAGLRGRKGHLYEGGIRVPCYIRWPGTLAPHTIGRTLSHIDMLPTLADWCGLGGTDGLALDGTSFAKLAENGNANWPERTLISFSQGQESKIRTNGTVHTDRWTAVQQRGEWELYDIQADIRQRHNVADEYPNILKGLSTQFEDTLATMPPLGKPAPVPVGVSGNEITVLEGQDAFLPILKGKGIDYNYPAGFSHHWVSRWTNKKAYPEWNVDVVGEGGYEVTLLYCIPESDLGVKAHLEIQEQKLPIRITEAFDPLPNPQPFLLDGEAAKYQNKDWKRLKLGNLLLKKGNAKARIRVTDIPGEAAMEVKELIFRKL